LALIPTTQFFVKLFIASDKRRIDVMTLEMIMGLKTLSSKWPFEHPMVQATWLPITYAATMVKASH
jgi:hypothetical protein